MEFNSRSGKEKVVGDETNRKYGYSGINNLPSGLSFQPSDEELLLNYLTPKVNNMDLPPNLMHEVDLFDPNSLEDNSPIHLTQRYEAQGKGEWYFFTPRHRKYPNGNRPSRSVGGGFWRATNSVVKIRVNGEDIGDKRSLVYYMGTLKSPQKTNWLMMEYKLCRDRTKTLARKFVKPPKSTRIKLDDWVLCKIYHNKRGKSGIGATAVLQANNSNNIECPTNNGPINADNQFHSLPVMNAPTSNNMPMMMSSGFEMGNSSGSTLENACADICNPSNDTNFGTLLPNDGPINAYDRFHNLPMMTGPINAYDQFHNFPMMNGPINAYDQFHNLPMMNVPINAYHQFHNLPMMNGPTTNYMPMIMSSGFEIGNSSGSALENACADIRNPSKDTNFECTLLPCDDSFADFLDPAAVFSDNGHGH